MRLTEERVAALAAKTLDISQFLVDRVGVAPAAIGPGNGRIPLTYHDPCQISRRGGVHEQPRTLLNQLAPQFREMTDSGVMNWCCGGGGGVSANERAEELRFTVFKRKKAQIEELGVKTMVTACANCRVVMEEALEHYHMNVEILGLTELVAEHLDEGQPNE